MVAEAAAAAHVRVTNHANAPRNAKVEITRRGDSLRTGLSALPSSTARRYEIASARAST